MADFITELRERRVLPAVGVYVASCWVVVEILDRLVDRYLLSPYLTDIVFWGLFSLLPAVCLIAWSYGRPGKDTATRAQKIGVPINVLATAGLLLAFFGGKDLGITAERVSVVNEEGEQETHIVPQEAARQRLAVFFFDNESGDPGLDWLQYAATELLTQDLQQDKWLSASSPYGAWGGGFYGRLKASGFTDGVGAPASLLRDIARDANIEYFTNGTVRKEGDELVLTTRLWDVRSMSRVAELEERGWDLYTLMDNTSIRVREALEVPSLEAGAQEDLPLAETYGESEGALKAYIAGLNARLIDNDIPGALGQMDAALAEDPAFVMALFVKGMMITETGNFPAAAEVLAQAQELDYRLPANDRAILKAMHYRATGQSERLMDFIRLQVRLSGEARWHVQLATLLMVSGELAEAKEHFEQALAKDALNTGLLLTLSDLDRSLGDMEGAIDYARRYQAAQPEDIGASLKLGDLLRDTGDLEAAQTHYEQAQLLKDDTVSPLLRQHTIAARLGDDARARRLLEDALATARTASQFATVHVAAHFYEARMGRVDAAIEQMRAAERYMSESQPPFAVALTVHTSIVGQYLRLDDLDAARAVLQEAREIVVVPPMNQFLETMEAGIAAFEGRYEEAWEHLARFEAVLEQLGFNSLAFQVPLVSGEIAYREGRYAEAAAFIEAGIDEVDRSFIAGEMYAHGMPMFISQLAELQVLAGQLESAEHTIERGFLLDPNEPNLWVAQARLQKQRGEHQLARASIDHALATWSDADPALGEYIRASELAREIPPGGP